MSSNLGNERGKKLLMKSKETNYNSTHRTAYPFKYEQQKVLEIFKYIKKSSSSDITYGKFTSSWYKNHISDFFIGAFKVAQLCGGGNISDKKLQAYMEKIFKKYYLLWGNCSIEELNEELIKFPRFYDIEPLPEKKELMDSKKLFIRCEDNPVKQITYTLLKRRKTKLPLEIGTATTIEKAYQCLDDYIQKDEARKIKKVKQKEQKQKEFEQGIITDNHKLKHLDAKTEAEMAFNVFESLNIGYAAQTLKCAKIAAVKKKYRDMFPEMGRGTGKANDPYFQKLYLEYRSHMKNKE